MREDKELTDSDGLRIVTVHDEAFPEDAPSLNAAAREAYEAELAAQEEEASREEAGLSQ